jgi:nitroreductase
MNLIKKTLHFIWRLISNPDNRFDFYYALNGRFQTEHKAVISGLRAFKHGLEKKTDEGLTFFLRRSIHRLEKGLIMRPRRSIFAVDYIEDAVEVYGRLLNSGRCQPADALILWATGVLEQYFSATTSVKERDAAEARFKQIREALDIDASSIGPIGGALSDKIPSFEQVQELARGRRSVRWYLPRAVPREIIDRAIEVAAQSPSACNRQPFEFLVFDDPELVRKVADIPQGCSGFVENFPCVVLIIGKLNAFSSEADRHVIYVDGGLAAMSFQYALISQGVGSCCINWPAVQSQDDAAATLLGLEPYEKPVMMISLGYPDPEGLVPISYKKQLSDLRTYNRVKKTLI